MDRIEVDGHILEWERRGQAGQLTVRPLSSGVPAFGSGTTFRLRVDEDRLKVELALLPTSRTVDVSLQPDLFGQVLPVDYGSSIAGSAGSTVIWWIVALLTGTRAWCPSDPDGSGLVATAGGAALALLGSAYDRGAGTLGEVPRWAGPVLAGLTARDGARAGFGAKATRTVARALVDGLVGEVPPPPPGVRPMVDGGAAGAGRVALFRLAVALMAEPSAEPDQIARLLCSPGPAHPPEQWPNQEQIAIGRIVARHLGPTGTERLLAEAVARDDGPALLAEVCRLAPGVLHLLPPRPAHRLEDLRDQCRSLLPTDPDPRAGGWSRIRRTATVDPASGRRAPNRGAGLGRSARAGADRQVPSRPGARAGQRSEPRSEPGPARPPDPRRRMHVAPAAPEVAPNTPLLVADEVTALHGAEIGHDLRIVVPRSTDELVSWGHMLRNCVGSFGPAVAAGRSLLIGVESGGALTYCLELAPDGTVRQFLGERNRPVPQAAASAVCRHLEAAGLLRADRSANRIWLEA